MISKQLSLIDLSEYSTNELTGSHNDDLEDSTTVRKQGRKSKYDPTWDMDDRALANYRASYAGSVDRVVKQYPPASFF
ncbi:MAG: hypothetical protein ACRC62_36915 [Microcoleus sp.]